LSILFIFKETAFCFIDSLYGFFFCLDFIILALIFIISLLMLFFVFACSCFSRSLRLALGHLFEIFLSF
jgi:hypothetical protein